MIAHGILVNLPLATPVSQTGVSAIAQILITVASTVTAAAILYLANSVRRGVKKLAGEHDWLMKQTASNTEDIKNMTTHIEAIVTDRKGETK